MDPLTFKDNRIPWVDLEVATAGEPLVRLAAYIDVFDDAHDRLHIKPNSHFREPFPASQPATH